MTTATLDSQMHADWNGAEIGIREGTIHRTGIHSNVRTAYSSADLILTGFSG